MKQNILFKRIALLGAGLLAFQFLVPVVQNANAATLTNTYVRLDRMKASTASSVRVVFRTSAVNGTEDNVVVGFPSHTVNASQTVDTSTCAAQSGATALPGTLSAAGDNTAKTVTVSGVTDLAVSTTYCFDLTDSAVTNPAVGQYRASVTTNTSAPAEIDTTEVGLRIIADDEIVVSAVVPPTFNFVLNGNTDSFASELDPGTVVNTGGRTATITTNASKGWICWVKDNQQGLSSATAPYTINTVGTRTPSTSDVDGSPSTLTAGAEGYALDVDLTTDAADGGTVTVAPEYNGTTTAQGGTLDDIYQPVASANGTADGDVITLIERAAIKGSTPAGNDYTDTLSIVAAGHF